MTAPDWPDLESLLVKVLPQRVAVDGVSTVTPPTLDGKRWLRVTYGPGSESTVDESVLMDVEALPRRGWPRRTSPSRPALPCMTFRRRLLRSWIGWRSLSVPLSSRTATLACSGASRRTG